MSLYCSFILSRKRADDFLVLDCNRAEEILSEPFRSLEKSWVSGWLLRVKFVEIAGPGGGGWEEGCFLDRCD